MVKFKLIYNKDAETEWLNNMAAEGYALTGFCAGFYSFEPCAPGRYVYQVDFSEGFFRLSQDYREFMTEAGVEIVSVWGPWVILRKEAVEGAFELYTDVESTIDHYKKIRRMFKAVALLEALCLIMQIPAVATGSGTAWAGAAAMLVLGAIFLAIMREVGRINDILLKLYERVGMEPDCAGLWRGRRLSMLIPMGMLFNAAALLTGNGPFDTILHRTLQILAIILILAGLVRTRRTRE